MIKILHTQWWSITWNTILLIEEKPVLFFVELIDVNGKYGFEWPLKSKRECIIKIVGWLLVPTPVALQASVW